MKKTSILSAAAALSLAFAGGSFAQAPAGSPVAENGTLKVSGGQILNQNDEPVQLRGVSLYWTIEENARKYYNDNVVKALRDDWKGNLIRAAMGVGGCKGSWKPGYSNAGDAHDKAVEDVVTAAVKYGIYVIVDWHSHEAHNQTSAAKAYFERVATKYKDVPNVIFEIYNEPIDINGCTVEYDKANPSKTWSDQIKPYSETIVQAIRDKGANNIIILGTPYYCQYPGIAAQTPVVAGGGKNLAYSFHYYAAEHSFFGRVAETVRLGKAVFVSEFGTVMASGDGTVDKNKSDSWFEVLDTYQVSWANWAFANMGQTSSAFTGDASGGNFSSASESGAYIRDKLIKYATAKWSVNVTTEGQGTVTKFPKAGSDGKNRHGVPVTLTAVPAEGWKFTGWSGAATGSDNPVTLSPLYADKSVKAIFTQGGNLIVDGTFFDPATNWKRFPSDASSGSMSKDADGLKVEIKTAGTSRNDSYIYQGDIPLTQNHKYRLSFKAKSTGARTVTVAVSSQNYATNYLDPPYDAALGGTMKDFSLEFTHTKANVANARVRFQCGDAAGTWYLNDVRLEDLGGNTGVAAPASARSVRAAWSIANTAAGVQLRGPTESGAKVSLYDTRGKAVKTMAAKDGMTLNAAGLPTGSYLVVVKNRAGADVYKSRVSFVR